MKQSVHNKISYHLIYFLLLKRYIFDLKPFMKSLHVKFFIVTTIFATEIKAQKQIFEIPGLRDSIAKQKIVAILPFKATISYKRMPKNFDAEGNKRDQINLASNMQQGMYTYLLRKSDNYSVSFQEVERTNILLKQAKIYDSLDLLLPDSICKILKVDAVIKGIFTYEKTGSEAGAIAKAVLFGFGGSTGTGSLTMQINGATGSGALLWRFYKEMNEGIGSSGNELMERMMRKVSRNFPYEK